MYWSNLGVVEEGVGVVEFGSSIPSSRYRAWRARRVRWRLCSISALEGLGGRCTALMVVERNEAVVMKEFKN